MSRAGSKTTPSPFIGGQAVIEGVMMRAPHAITVVCRRKSGELVVRERPWAPATRGPRSWPFIRGVAAVRESLGIGSKALRWSAALYDRDLTGGSTARTRSTLPSSVLSALLAVTLLATRADDEALGEGRPLSDPIPDEKPRKGAAILPIVFALTLLFALPQGLAELVNFVLGLELPLTSVSYQLLTGGAQMGILVAYLLLLRRVPEIRRVFEYHGAEHKTVTAYEAGEELTLAAVRARTTLHARCGTTFLVMVALVSIVAFTFAGALVSSALTQSAWLGFGEDAGGGRLLSSVLFFALKLPLIPLVAAFTFELQRLLARLSPEGPLGFLLWPGFGVQRITTAEPDDSQLEVAVAALRLALGAPRAPEQARSQAAAAPDRVFSSFGALCGPPGAERGS